MSSGGNLYEDGGIDQTIQQILNRLSALERSNKLSSASIGAGGLTVKDGGAINVEDGSGIIQVLLNAMGLNVGSGLVVVDDQGVDVGGGLVVLDANGVSVDSGNVVLDDDGLQVNGGFVTPIWVARFTDEATNASLTTTDQVVNSFIVSPPAWVETLYLDLGHYAEMTDAGPRTLFSTLDIGAGQFSRIAFTSAGTNSSGMNSTAVATSGFPITVEQESRVLSGSNSANYFTLKCTAFGIRNP